jgi:hypothetical protein
MLGVVCKQPLLVLYQRCCWACHCCNVSVVIKQQSEWLEKVRSRIGAHGAYVPIVESATKKIAQRHPACPAEPAGDFEKSPVAILGTVQPEALEAVPEQSRAPGASCACMDNSVIAECGAQLAYPGELARQMNHVLLDVSQPPFEVGKVIQHAFYSGDPICSVKYTGHAGVLFFPRSRSFDNTCALV